MKTKGCVCHNGKYKIWLSATGECQYTVKNKAAIKKLNDKQIVKNTKFVSKQKTKKPIKKLSDKQRIRNAEFKRVKEAQFLDEWIDGGGFIQCEIRVEGCMNNACDPHHPIDRVGDNLLMDCIPACRPCHNWCKDQHKYLKSIDI